MAKYTDEQIKEAVEYCSKQGITSDCTKCKLKADECRPALMSYALDLINRQKAEIERLQEYYKLYYERQREIEELNVQIEQLNGNLKFVRGTAERQLDEIKGKDRQIEELVSFQRFCESKAIKEFVLTLKCNVVRKYEYTDIRVFKEIDNLVKEMVGEGE